ncbi:MAG: P-loop NTPase [Anaerolineales bacterium]
MPPQDSEVRLLLVSTGSDALGELDDALEGWGPGHRSFWVSQAELAASRALGLSPQIILVDDNVAASPERYIRQLVECCPMARVVALVEPGNLDMINRAVLAGARAVLPKPLEPRTLRQTLDQLLSQAAATPVAETANLGKVVAFVGPRGGVGRTSVACNAAVGLADLTEGVVIVDADFYAPAVDVMLNVPARRTIAEVFERQGLIDADYIDGILQRHASGAYVLAAEPMDQMEIRPSMVAIERLLVVLREMFPWTLVDLGNPLDDVAMSVIDAADVVILVLPPEMAAMRAARSVIERLQREGYDPERLWIVLNRATAPQGVPQSEIERRLGPVRHRLPDDPPIALASINQGVPVAMRYPRSALGRAYLGLSRKLVDELAVKAEVAPELVDEAASTRRGGRRKQ